MNQSMSAFSVTGECTFRADMRVRVRAGPGDRLSKIDDSFTSVVGLEDPLPVDALVNPPEFL